MSTAKLLIRKALSELIYHSGALRFFRKGSKSWRILMYHRITSPELCGHPLQPGMYVTPEHFAMHMDELHRTSKVLPLEELCEAVKSGKAPADAVAITFDDGWQDNYANAFPVLRKHGFPATIFLATSFIGTEKTFWSDAIPRSIAFLRNQKWQLPIDLGLDTIEQERLAKVLHSDNASFVPNLDEYVNRCKRLSEGKRNALAETLSERATELGASVIDRSFLNWQEVSEMATGKISFGSHTHSHTPLTELEPSAIEVELEASRSAFLKNGIQQSSIFCYPEGRCSEAAQKVLARLEIQGALAVSTVSVLDTEPPLYGRIGMHDDITNSRALFSTRLWLQR